MSFLGFVIGDDYGYSFLIDMIVIIFESLFLNRVRKLCFIIVLISSI